MRPKPQEPWASFLRALDELVESPVEIHCLGGFAITMLYGVDRATHDIDILVAGGQGVDFAALQRVGGEGSDLHRRFKVFVQPVAVATYPENYSTRLIPIWPELSLKRIRVFGLEAHDLALTKLERNIDTDREDVQELARKGLIDPETLSHLYVDEFRPNLAAGAERHDLTLEFWIQMIREVQGSQS